MGNILVVAEIQGGQIREASYELASFANRLSSTSGRGVKSLVLGSGVGSLADEFSKKGGISPEKKGFLGSIAPCA